LSLCFSFTLLSAHRVLSSFPTRRSSDLSQFKDIEVFSEVLQDGIFDLIDAGVVKSASATAFSLSKKRVESLAEDLEKYKDKIVFRPQEISNNPEVIRRLGVISFNTPIEVDI